MEPDQANEEKRDSSENCVKYQSLVIDDDGDIDMSETLDQKTVDEAQKDINEPSTSLGAIRKDIKGHGVDTVKNGTTEPDPGPSSNGGGSSEATSSFPSVRKKRFLSRNYRNHDYVDSSSSEDEKVEDVVMNNSKKSRKAVSTTGNPPPPEYLDELATNNGREQRDSSVTNVENNEDAGANEDNEEPNPLESEPTVTSSSYDSSSSNSDLFDRDNDTDSAAEDEDVTFLNTDRPKCTWVALRELFYREHGLSGAGRRSMAGRDPSMFKRRVCGSLNVVERLELMYKMEKHDGCVNSLNFSQDGRLLASGSDDLQVVIWNWATNTVADEFNSGHSNNVFQTKFYGTQLPDLRLITSARDGLVRNFIVPSSGGKPYSTTLFKHIGSVHRVAVCPNNPFTVMTAGEDGMVISVDLREKTKPNRLVTVKENKRKIILYGIAVNPMNDEFLVYGRNKAVKIYDKRNTKTMIRELYPEDVAKRKSAFSGVSSAVYNHLGTEVLASYSDDDIYLFNNNEEEPGHFSNRYKGHLNTQTIKGVNFFGTGSEFVVSGSDCGNIFFWDKKTSKIVQWLRGDENGAINVLGK